MKKLTSVFLSVVMLMSVLCMPALASGQDSYLQATADVNSSGMVVVEVKATEATTNGKFTVDYAFGSLAYLHSDIEGVIADATVDRTAVTVYYVTTTDKAIEAGATIATLWFTPLDENRDTALVVSILEFNAYEDLNIELPALEVTLPGSTPSVPTPPTPSDPKPPVDDPDDGKDDEGKDDETKPGIEIAIEIPELTEEKYESIVVQYSDIPENWATDSIVEAINAGLFNGTSDNTFSPEAKMTRAQLMTVLARLAGVDTTGGSIWYEKGMEWSKENGISDGSNPNKNITRQELVTMLYRFAGEPATNGSLAAFTDASSVSGYAVDAMKWAVENGIINGMGDGTLAPQGEATRAQMAKILMFFINL